MQKFGSFGRKKKQTKIRHRMVMLEGLQFLKMSIFFCYFIKQLYTPTIMWFTKE